MAGSRAPSEASSGWRSHGPAFVRSSQVDAAAAGVKYSVVGYATIGIGGAVVLGGVVLLVTAPSGSVARVSSRFSPWASASAGGFEWKGTW